MKIYSIFLLLMLTFILNGQTQTYHILSSGNFTEDWTNIGLITTNDDWSNFPSIKGFLGDDGTTTANPRDPQLQLVDYTTMDVIANITNPNTNSSGGVGACVITNPVVALQGSGSADNPFLMVYLNTTGVTNIQVQYNLRDVDGSTDNSTQPIAFQYRVGTTGNFTNVVSAFVADASSGPSLATLETPVSLSLPVECENQSQVQIRIMTGNAVSSDEWIGIDDIVISGNSSSTNTVTFTITDNTLAPIAGATITINGQNLITDAFGIATINLPDATYPYTITAAGFDNASGDAIVAGSALAVNVTMTTTSVFTVTFTVSDNTPAPIAGATITINGQNLITDAFGIATINLPDATYPYTITASGFDNATGNAVVAGSALAVNVTMTTTPVFTVTFTVSDNTTAPIVGATITINAQNIITDAFGIATINLANATYPYTITAAGFDNSTGDAVVAGSALAVNVTLTTTTSPSGQVIISQYIETSVGTTPKGIELWNKSGVDIDFSISNLIIKQGTNGGVPANAITLNTGTLLNNAVLVIGTDADVSGTGTGFRTFVESNGATFVTNNFTFNGDDALEVWLDGILQDVFGTVGIDPGTSWTSNGVSTSNQNISLINGIITGDIVGWSDPSLRFETTTIDNSITGFGLAPVTLIPAKLNITDINGGSAPVINLPFYLTVGLTDTSGITVNATSDITVNLALNTGTGALSGTLSGIILTGTSSVTISNILYNIAETGVSIITSDNAMILESDTSSFFDVLDTANHLQFVNVPATGYTAVNLASFTVEALRADNSIDSNFTGNISIAITSGTGNISGTITAPAIAGVATFSDIQFDAADTYTISAASGFLTAAASGDIVITDVPNVATQLTFVGVPATGITNTILGSFTVEARKADNSVDITYVNDITLAVVSGTGNISGTIVMATVAGIATFSDIMFDAASTYTISAASGTLTDTISGDIIISDAVIPTNLPTTYNWAPASNYPQGWVNNGLTTYTTQGYPSADAGKFDTQDDNIIINYTGTADSLIYYLRGNSLSGAYQFDILESADGVNYTSLVSHTSTSNSITGSYAQYIAFPANATQFIKLNYTTKVSGNIGIDSTTITAKIFPVQLAITSVNNGFDPVINSLFDVVIQSQDMNGNLSSVVNNTDVTLSVATGSGVLGGTITGTITAGTNSLTITGLNYNVAETGISITATRTSGDILNDATSSLFNVLDTANHLQFVNVPVTGYTAVNLVSFTVEALRADNSIDINFTGNISITKTSGTGNLSGTIIATAVDGVATFSDIQFDVADTYTISASSGFLTDAASGDIIITDAPAYATQLAFVAVPSSGLTNTNLTSFSVEARKADNSIDVAYISNITIAKLSGTGNMTASFTVPAVAGVATFSDVQFDAADTYTITATSGTLTFATSGDIIITAPDIATQLSFVGVPSTGTTSVNLTSFTVEARKADNSVDLTYTNDITIAVITGTGNISGTVTTTAVDGVATFSDIQFDAASTYTISATSGVLTVATSGDIIITDPVIAAILPTSYDWTPSSSYPQGWTNNGLTFYTTGNLAPNSGKFDTQDDNITVFYDTSACVVEYYLKGNGLTIPYQLDLMESVDGITYTVLTTHSDIQNSLTSAYQYFSVSPALTSRYLKFNYTVKTTGNIAIDDVLIDLCVGINSNSKNKSEINIYPNPAKQVLNVTNINQNATISIMNILGEMVYSSTNIKQNKLSVQIGNLLPGIYILMSSEVNGINKSIRFVKE